MSATALDTSRRRARQRQRPATPDRHPETGRWTAMSARELLGLALVLMLGRFVSPEAPGWLTWLLGHVAAGAAVGLAYVAVHRNGDRDWTRWCALGGAALYQLGVAASWAGPIDPERTLSPPVVLCTLGAATVALAVWRWPTGDARPGWPTAAAAGAVIGFAALAVGAGRLLTFDVSELIGSGDAPSMEINPQMANMAQMMGVDPQQMMQERMSGAGMEDRLGRITDVASLGVIAALMTPLAFVALAVARRHLEPARAVGAFVGLASLPIIASGGVGPAVIFAIVAVLSMLAVETGHQVVAFLVVPAALLIGATVVVIGFEPSIVGGIGAYGAVLGGLTYLVVHCDRGRRSLKKA